MPAWPTSWNGRAASKTRSPRSPTAKARSGVRTWTGPTRSVAAPSYSLGEALIRPPSKSSSATRFAGWLRSQGRFAEGLQLVATLYAGFTEGFDTPDLREAKQVIDEGG